MRGKFIALAVALLTGAIAFLGAPVAQAAPSTAEQSITDFYCSGAVAVPGTYGTFNSCSTFALSSLNNQGVSKPVTCRIVNNTGKVLDLYRLAWTGGNGAIVDKMSFGRVGTGTHDIDCNSQLSTWLYRYSHNYMRESVQVSGASYGTVGANAPSP